MAVYLKISLPYLLEINSFEKMEEVGGRD